jgi:hypothetical protein
MMEERIGETFELDERLTVLGIKLRLGEPAPDFVLDHLDPTGGTIRPVRLADSAVRCGC